MVMRSSPACPSSSSSLPNALTENGQVGSRNTSKTRGPLPHTSGSARHVFVIRPLLVHLVCPRPGSAGSDARAPECPPVLAEQRLLDRICQCSAWTTWGLKGIDGQRERSGASRQS